MAITHLFDNATMANLAVGSSYDRPWETGTRFVPTGAGAIEGLRWYRFGSGSSNRPTGLHLWDCYTQQLILSAPSVPDNGSVGWQTWNASAAVQIEPGRTYAVSYGVSAGNTTANLSGSDRGTPPGVLQWAEESGAQSSPSPIFPAATTASNWVRPVDVLFNEGATGTILPITPAQVSGDLASWLISTNDNQHQSDGLPWLSHAILEGLRDGTITYFSDLQARTLAIKAITDALPGGTGEIANRLVEWEAGRLGAIIAQLGGTTAPVLTSNPLGGSGTGNALTDTINALRGASTATTTDLLTALEACCDWLTGAVLDEAKLSAPTTAVVNGYGYLASGRRIHRISVGTVPPDVGSLDIEGNLWLPRFGWWAPVTSQGAVLERHYIDWQEQWLWPAPAATVGIAYHLPLGVDATIYAYDALAGW